jgi:hypothetical protein
VSTNGIDFVRNPANPIFGPLGSGIWNNGRVIDADYIEFNGKMWLSCTTRNTANTTQQVVVAVADIGTNYSSSVWTQINPSARRFRR